MIAAWMDVWQSQSVPKLHARCTPTQRWHDRSTAPSTVVDVELDIETDCARHYLLIILQLYGVFSPAQKVRYS